MSANTDLNNDEFDAVGAVAGAAMPAIGEPPDDDDTPEWAKEGTDRDDDDIAGEDVSAAKPMEGQAEWIEPAKGVLFTIEKAVIEPYTPRGEDVWKSKQMNVWLKVTDGIIYKRGEKPKFKGKLFFHRFYVAVNREAEEAGIYDFSVNANGKPTDYWRPRTGMAWGEYNELLQALGYANDGSQRNNKEFRDSLKGRQIVYDIEKDVKEQWDNQTKKSTKLKGEYQNVLRHAAPAKSKSAASVAAPAAVAATTEVAEWDKE